MTSVLTVEKWVRTIFSMTWPKHNLPQSTVEPTNHCATLGSVDTVRICYFRKTKLKHMYLMSRSFPWQNAEIMLWSFHIYLLHEQEFASKTTSWSWQQQQQQRQWLERVWKYTWKTTNERKIKYKEHKGHKRVTPWQKHELSTWMKNWGGTENSPSPRIVTQNSPRMTRILVSTISDREPGAPSARLRKEANFCCINFVATREPLSRLRRNAKVV